MSARERRSTLTGLLGQGIGPSLSPELHEREAQRQGMRSAYKVVELLDAELSPDRLGRLLEAAVRLGFDGINVTHPVKQVMVPLVDRLTPAAAGIGALNTITIAPDGETVGHNTDVTGFTRAAREGLADVARGTVLLLGAGGAGTAVAHALVDLGARRLHVVDPDADRAARLTTSVTRRTPDVVLERHLPDDVPALLARVDGLVNATPVGMAAHPGTPFPVEALTDRVWVADIVYRPLRTALLDAALRTGCRVLSGAGMAVHQAADSFELFTGRPADRAAMLRDFDELVAAERGRLPHARDTEEERKH